jgi:PPM family protein phosphatase
LLAKLYREKIFMNMQQTEIGSQELFNVKRVITPFTFASRSIAHMRHPERNEDTIMIDRKSGLVAVFDGVGGANAGEVASRLGARVVRRTWKRIVQQLRESSSDLLMFSDSLDVQALLLQMIEEAQNAISDEGDRMVEVASVQEGKDTYPETTVAIVAFCQHPARESYIMGYAHAGDSRIYLLRADEPLKRLTLDDGYFMLKIQDETLSEEDALRIDQATHVDQLSEMEREIFNKRNGITQCLGHFTSQNASLMVHTAQIEIFPGDRILLCSDGIHDNLTDAEIEALIRLRARTTVAHHLVEGALRRSEEECLRAKQDDMSAVVITCNFS